MLTIQQQIEEIEEVLRKTPHHKATNGFIGAMRAKIARLKDREVEIQTKGGGGGGGYAVKKTGDASVALIGPPSAGKSTLINELTNTQSKVAEYAFTTVSVIPGMMKYNEAYIQIFDIPGLIEGASFGKGRGKEVLSVARNADLLIIMTDPLRIDQLQKLSQELEGTGIRINKTKPQIFLEKTVSGGIEIKSNIKQEFDNETIKNVAQEFGFKNGTIVLKEKVNLDGLIDSFSKRIIYKPALFVINKADTLKTKKEDNCLYISAKKKEGLDDLKKHIWEKLNFVKIYLVEKDEEPNSNNPFITKQNATLLDVANSIGTDFSENKKLAKIWEGHARFPGQVVPLTTKVVEGIKVKFI